MALQNGTVIVAQVDSLEEFIAFLGQMTSTEDFIQRPMDFQSWHRHVYKGKGAATEFHEVVDTPLNGQPRPLHGELVVTGSYALSCQDITESFGRPASAQLSSLRNIQ